MVAPVFHVEPAGEGRVAIRVRSAAALAVPVRQLAWFVVVVGLTGLAALAVLRVPAAIELVYVAFFALTAAIVVWDTQSAGLRVEGELELHLAKRRLERRTGFAILGWERLVLPTAAVLVVDNGGPADTRRMIAGLGHACRLIAVPVANGVALDALWTSLRDGDPPHGVPIVESVGYDVARGLSESLSRALDWPVFDLASSEPEWRMPTELDVPLASRLDALIRGIPADDPSARPWGVARWTDPVGTHLGLRAFGLAGLIAQVGLAVPLLGFLYLLSGGNLGIPLLGAGLLAFGYGVRTEIDLSPRGAAIRPLNVWLPLGKVTLVSWEQVEQVHAVVDRGSVGIRFVTDGGSVLVPTSSRAAARWAAAEVRKYLLDRSRAR
jgi:hypothetical protein